MSQTAKVPGSILGIDREFSGILCSMSLPPPLWARYMFIPGKVQVLTLPREKAGHSSLNGTVLSDHLWVQKSLLGLNCLEMLGT